MTYYYWGPGASGNQYYQQPFFGQGQVQQTPLSAQSGNVMTPSGTVVPSTGRQTEESYIENILRENIGVPGTFYFTFPSSETLPGETRGNVLRVRGTVLQAGRDHAVIREESTNHVYLLPMIYFDYARFDEGFRYINSARPRSQR
ncbi:MAG: spore coat protein GerQ [Bacilli bacterium]|uniref:Spore coat protein GerQ n=1 Tax=Ureibacillus suwonensis TaxID=313007 RepID=A0ABW0R9D3_9BACL